MSPGVFQPSIFKPRFDRNGANPADMVVLSARIFTSNISQPRAEALAVRGDRIAYVGDNRGVRDFIGPDTLVINARRRTVTPGFVDNHCHVLWVGSAAFGLSMDLYECESLDELRTAIRGISRDNPEAELVSGVGWRYEYMPGGMPDRELLDSIVGDRPVVLSSLGGQCGWLNTAAIEMLEGRNRAAFDLLKPHRDSQGRCTGTVHHHHSFSVLDFFTLEELGEGFVESMKLGMGNALKGALSVGVTTMHDVQIYRPFVPIVLEFKEEGGLDDVRIRGAYYVGYHVLEDEGALKEELQWWKDTGKTVNDAHLVLGDSLKFYIDGVPGNHTAFMLEPYTDMPGELGDPAWTQEGFDRVMEIIDGMGLQACTHSIGDAGIRRVVNAYEHAIRTNGERDARHRCDHCELPTAQDRARMGRLGIHAAMQPTHFFGDKTFVETLGMERLQRLMPWRSLEEAGVTLSFGSDWCAGPINPLYGLLIASTRLNYELKNDWGSDEAVDLEDAVRHWTIDSARALKMEQDVGSIEVGKYADFVMFNTDPLKLDSWLFLLTHELALGALDDFVDMTVVGGEVVYTGD